MRTSHTRTAATLTALGIILAVGTAQAQKETGPKVEKTYGEGLPRDSATLTFADDQYPTWPLTPAQKD